MSANFTPNMEGYNNPGTFRFWCQRVLPLVYDDSLSYYELLCKVVNYINNLIQDNQATIENMDALLTAYNQLQDYVNNYFANLDLTGEVSNKIDEMVDNGELLAIIQPTLDALDEYLKIQSASQQAYNETTRDIVSAMVGHPFTANTAAGMTDTDKIYVFTGTTGGGLTNGHWYYYDGTAWTDGGIYNAVAVDIDKTLTLSDTAADSKTVGDTFDTLYDSLNAFGISFKFTGAAPEERTNGILYGQAYHTITASGTATANHFINLLLYPTLPFGINSGDTIYIDRAFSDATKFTIQMFTTVDGGTNWTMVASGYGIPKQYKIPSSVNGLLFRTFIANGAVVNDYCSVSIYRYPTNNAVSKKLESTNDNRDRTDDIEAMLTDNLYCKLGNGTFYIDSLAMPDNSVLDGCGDSTILIVENGDNGIYTGSNCTIKNVRIMCNAGHTGTRATGSAIIISGNYDDAPTKGNTKLSDITIQGFPCAGIHGQKTGYFVGNSISAVNCKIYNCWAGVLLEDKCEYNRFTNCLMYGCYIGANIYSGNNCLSNCSIDNNSCGVLVDGTDASLSANTGHGMVIGCTINHTNSGNGYAVIIKGNPNGFVIDGCSIMYGKISLDTGGNGSAGIIFSNCLFTGGDSVLYNWGATAALYIGCMFLAAPTFTGNKPTIKANCYLFDGTPVV